MWHNKRLCFKPVTTLLYTFFNLKKGKFHFPVIFFIAGKTFLEIKDKGYIPQQVVFV
jgi:hypothetical protein